MPVSKVIPGLRPVKIWTDEVEPQAAEQLARVGSLPFIHKHVAVMPDVHHGRGATIGSVIPTKGAIIPAAVGVDLGCGMMAVRLGKNAAELPDSLSAVRSAIEAAIPHGRTDNGGPNDKGAWCEPPDNVMYRWGHLSNHADWLRTKEEHPKIKDRVNTHRHLATLGTGNHFIELCLDQEDQVWVMLHTGSRGIGNRIGSYFIELAKEEMRRWYINLPDDDLAYLPEGSQHFDAYVRSVNWAQEYARTSRELMMDIVLNVLAKTLPGGVFVTKTAVNCHHNYVAKENHYGANVWVTRKGAVRARKGDLGIIPGSMGDRSYIVEGLGNPESFNSCSHGAGRKMSRAAASKLYTTTDLIKQTMGVECRKDADVIDEIPGAYKNIDEVMYNQRDLVRPLFTLKQVLCVKG